MEGASVFFQAEDGIRAGHVTGVQTCALPICRVLRGRQIGRTLGFPTVNIRPPLPPALSGVMAVRVSGGGLNSHPGVASLGQRPVLGGTDWLLEVHLFNFDGDLYGLHLEVEFVEYIRPELPFDSLADLGAQMNKDAHEAQRMLAAASP